MTPIAHFRALAVFAAHAFFVVLAVQSSPAAALDPGWPDAGPGVGAGGARWLGPSAPSQPKRVVSLAPSLTDVAVALGQSGKLVGVTRYDDAPEVARLPRVGGFLDPNPEAVLAVKPDLVLWLTDSGAFPAVQRLTALGLPVLALPVVNVADVLASARFLGSVLGVAAAGERLAHDLETEIAQVRERAARLPKVRVLLVLGRTPLMVAGPASYPGELLALAGGRNVVESSRPWVVYPLERAVADNPDLVIDAAVNEPAAEIERLSAIPAVRRGAVRRLANDDLLRPGPRLGRALPALLAALHPEAKNP